MRRTLLIVNPNTNRSVTAWLTAEAQRVAGDEWIVLGTNAASGLAAIRTPVEIESAAKAVIATISERPDVAGALIGAFGDPGLKEARDRLKTPVVGLGESGLLAAAEGGRRFAIVTLGQAMRGVIERTIAILGLADRLAAIRFLPVSIADVIADRDALRPLIGETVETCLDHDDAGAVLLGGAPFAGMALALGQKFQATVLDGVEASVARLRAQLAVDEER